MAKSDMSYSVLVSLIEQSIKDWENDPDTNTAEYALIQIKNDIDRKFNRPIKYHTEDCE